jgi:hypothetical protein
VLSTCALLLQLLDAGVDQADQVAHRRADQADDRHQRRGDRADDLAAEHVERRQRREVLDLRLADRVPSSMPPRIARIFVVFAESASAFATATMSPSASMNAIAVGPSSIARSASAPAASAARFVSVFFTTVNFAPLSITFVRSSSISVTDRPR